jgi:predicted acetyltransferase
MSDIEFRPLTPDDIDQAAHLEAVAFYNPPTPERADSLRRTFPLQRTLGAIVNGRLVADVRSVPLVRRINGRGVAYGTVGPVATLAEHRRKGYVDRLMRMTLEHMRERGVSLSGLHTPHDALYRRYGYERAEGNKRYVFRAKDVSLRFHGQPGSLERVEASDWQRLDDVYRRYAGPRNGPLGRSELWWREAVLFNYHENRFNGAYLWLDSAGEAQGFFIYTWSRAPGDLDGGNDILVRDFVSLTPDAYLALWQHLLTHDIARRIVLYVAADDHFSDLVVDPWKIAVERSEAAMIRIVDVERALAERPYCGRGAVSFTMHISDPSALWNEGTWRVRAGRRRMRAERTRAKPDVELSVNFLAPLYTGFLRADHAVEAGMLKLNRPGALPQIEEAFAVTHPPYCNDWF